MDEQPDIEAIPAPEQAEFEQGAPAAPDGAPGEGGERAGRARGLPALASRLPAALPCAGGPPAPTGPWRAGG